MSAVTETEPQLARKVAEEVTDCGRCVIIGNGAGTILKGQPHFQLTGPRHNLALCVGCYDRVLQEMEKD